MTPSTDSSVPFPIALEPSAIGKDASFLRNLGAELAFVQDATGLYRSFYWEDARSDDFRSASEIERPTPKTFVPLDLESYWERISQVLSSHQPQAFTCYFSDGQRSLRFKLVVSPILHSSSTVGTVLVMGQQVLPTDASPESDLRQTEVSPSPDPNPGMEGGQTPNLKAAESWLTPIAGAQILDRVARQIRHTLDLLEIWQQSVCGLGEALQTSQCLMCAYSDRDDGVRVVSEFDRAGAEVWLARKLKFTDYPEIDRALTELEPTILEESSCLKLGVSSGLVVATFKQEEPNGVLLLLQDDFPRRWHRAEIDRVREFADRVGTAIAHVTLYRELEKARQSAEELSQLKSDFLARTSHELRTPLNGILGFLKLILDGMADDPEEQMEFVLEAYRAGKHLLNLINDILDIAKIEAGKMELEFSPVELSEIFDELSKFVQTQVRQKGLYFQIRMPPTEDEIVLYCNYQRLLQVLLNLVGNAIKFTHEGGITISAEVIHKKLRVEERDCPGVLKFRIADTGIGVSLDKQNKLFQSFSQIDSSRTRQYGGTGLGLAISQKLIESMGGVVNFYSMGEGLGSTVTFTVPLFQEPLMVSDDSIPNLWDEEG
ncbi:MAG TPA: histidine kinase [Oscillatoriales cyanobacterium M59_W2019_021]|nr:MAG: hybrid sensor histidine kinase/response regulator [Cyanobacteria bacterium J055]HIK32007.1 histidine kinase [Oscillatoriales cyanobacterium M4454_W2019_049]HIK51342.1 histidine kinase [Oscillatoriales cyanobacterium M59_W2019_021]